MRALRPGELQRLAKGQSGDSDQVFGLQTRAFAHSPSGSAPLVFVDAGLQDVRDLRQVTSLGRDFLIYKRGAAITPTPQGCCNVRKGRNSEADVKRGFMLLSPQAVHSVPTVCRDRPCTRVGWEEPTSSLDKYLLRANYTLGSAPSTQQTVMS